ncbi:efflux RND transporter periplasmic adaptor subunit [Niallia circulans]|uniref:efflux RND transporter periplasmic adaptor subunit n=1 Tax=Niallia circulans TaxID=1397 RepID=UPI00300BBEC0
MKAKIIISLLAAGGIILSFFQYYYMASKSTGSNGIKSDIYTISSGEKIFINGLIEPIEVKEIYIDSSKGIIHKTHVIDGQVVKKGDLLFEYVNSSVTEQIQQLNIQMESSYKEIEQLENKKKSTENKLVEQQKKLKEQQKQLKEEQKKAEEQQKILEEERKQVEEQQEFLEEEQKQTEQESGLEERQESIPDQIQDAQQINNYILESDESILSGEVLTLENEISAFDEQIASVQNQVATVEKQKKLLKKKEYTKETAPMEGRIILNDMDNTQSAYITIESTEYYVNGNISEKDLPKLKIGQQSEVLIHSTNEKVTGEIEYIGKRPIVPELSANMVNSNSNVSNYLVKIKLDSQENLINGYHVQVNVKLSDSKINIPRSAIIEEEGSEYVYKVEEEEYIKQVITYQEVNSDEVLILSGLNENEKIILNPTSILKEEEGISNE